MKTTAVVVLLAIVTTHACPGGIGDQLVELFHAKHASALVPAKEKRVNDVDPLFKDRTHGMVFDPSKATALEKGKFEELIRVSAIKAWNFGMQAPWTPGAKTDLIVLNAFGQPYLAIRLVQDQPDLIVIRQVIGLEDGVATLGRAHHFFYRCEITSAELVAGFRRITNAPNKMKFIPASYTPPNEEALMDELEAEIREQRKAESGRGRD